jgi:uncharacterized membrane protein YphA (DoxX/SURF4 family)
MKISVRIIQFIVGILFIISGLVKANDPLGLSYKMQEFFEIWNESLGAGSFFAKGILINLFDFLHQHSLLLSVVMIALEIVTGIALMIGWKKKFILYLLLVLIVFFTFLTGYALLSKNPDGSPKFTNCGCFGDCLPITPGTSFTKDIVLLLMIIFLIIGQKYIQPLFTNRFRSVIVSAFLIASILIQVYVLHYLPFVDCLPFKKGNNIAEQMKPPVGSVPDSIAIRFIYEKAGKRYEFAPENLPADFETYTYIDRIDKLVRKGNAEPKIKGFSLTGAEIVDSTSGTSTKPDSTAAVLSRPYALIGFGLNEMNNDKWLDDFKLLSEVANKKNIPVYFASNDRNKYVALFKKHAIQNVEVFDCDFTIIRTAARTNPIVYQMKSGTIQNKFGYHNFDKLADDIKK